MGSTSRLHPNMDAQHQKSHTAMRAQTGPPQPGPRTQVSPAPGRSPRQAGQQGAGPRAWAQDGGSCSVLAAAWSGDWGWTPTTWLGPSTCWREEAGGAAGQGGAMGCRERGARVPCGLCRPLPVAADTCGDQRCEMEWTDGQTVGTLSLCCPKLNLVREAQQPVS